jgi:EAL domain-containing protein (putative c-di-GMP-specific phosphodiesterase class I)
VLSEACRQLARWREEDLVGAGLPVSVNISSRSLSSPAFTDTIERTIAAARMPPACLSLEVTETSVDRDPARTANVLADLDRLGVRLVLDDFGTGRSSLGTLSSSPFDVVKIDRGATASAAADPGTARILGAVLGVARAAGLQTVAEGIETPSQLDAMRTLGCDAGQGFLFAAPAPAEQMSAWLASRKG